MTIVERATRNAIDERVYVARPTTADSTVGDICFTADISKLARHFIGGLNPADIVAVFDSDQRAIAHTYAAQLISELAP